MDKLTAKRFIDANVWDGDDRSGCKDDWAKFSPDELQELIDDLIDYLAQSPDSDKLIELSKFINSHLETALKAQREACAKSMRSYYLDFLGKPNDGVMSADYINNAILNAKVGE